MLKEIIKTRRKRRELLNFFVTYLRNGIYYYDGFHLSKRPHGSSFCKNIYQMFVVFSLKQKRMQLADAIITQGTYKKCILLGDVLYSFCLDKSIYERNKRNYLQISDFFPYPFAKTLSFDDDKQLICVEYVVGKTFNDREHLIRWAKCVLNDSCKAKSETRNGVTYYIQHGDAWYQNIIWYSETDFKFIDLDNIGMWPAFYDLILCLTVSFGSNAFSIIENDLMDEVRHLCQSKEIVLKDHWLDRYYYEFVKIWLQRERSVYERIIRPFYDLDDAYVNTKAILP